MKCVMRHGTNIDFDHFTALFKYTFTLVCDNKKDF